MAGDFMFLRGYSALMSAARPQALPSPAATGAAREWAQAGAHLAMSRELGDMPLSRRLANPAAYVRLQAGRRQALEALVSAEADVPALERVTDLLCMLVEEASWAQSPVGAPFDDDQHPTVDFQCAETLALIAWTRRALGERLGSRVCAKLLYEARRRVFSPFLAHGDYPFMRFVGPGAGQCRRTLCILCDIVLAALLMETDASRRGAVLKQGLRLLDEAVQAHDRAVLPLEDKLAETAAVTDLCALLRKLTRGEMDLTEALPPSDWLDGLLFPWLGDSLFADPAAGDMRPALSGQELFRVGLACGDEALSALGAALHRAGRRPSATVTGRLLDLACAGMLSAQVDPPPRLKHAATADNRVMVSRFGGMTACLHTGGERGNAGALLLTVNGKPVLVEVPGHASLPLIGGQAQVAAPGAHAPEAAFGAQVCPADFQIRSEGEQMSVDLTHAWPVHAGVRSMQRTVMAVRQENALRLVDAFDLERPALLAFRFVTPQRPERLTDGIRLGPATLAWEGALSCDIAPLNLKFPSRDPAGSPLYAITLATPGPIGRAFYTFGIGD